MIGFNSLSLRRGVRLLFENVGFTLHSGQKVGITGANGAGKSSLFSLLLGELQADSGELTLPPGVVIAHVAQEVVADGKAAIEYVIDGDRELRTVQQALDSTDADLDGMAYAQLHARFDAIGGYQARARAARLLNGLGFQPEEEARSVAEFSGGWRMRLNLAKALMCRSDILLLDEPTNHLDLDAVIWLQEWLSEYGGTLLLISHDRDFLDEITDCIVHIENQSVTLYSGNYSSFEARRAEMLAQRQAAYDKQQREVRHIQSFIDRFRAQATKARQAQSRLKALARMELITQAHADSPFEFAFPPPPKLPRPLLRLDEADVGYPGTPLLKGVELTLSPGDRIGLLGANGAGKSTLIKSLAGSLALLAGQLVPSQDLRLGYFAQHQVEQLDMEASPLLHLQRLDARVSEKELRGFLGGFSFQGDMALAPVGPFSGGEKARLALALLIFQKPNLLLLDEPTNHLDLEMRHALALALQDYEGALVLVSHDRYLLRSVCDDFWLVANGAVTPFEGDLDDYRRHLTDLRRATPATATRSDTVAASRKDQRRLQAEKRSQLGPLRKTLNQAEARLDALSLAKHAKETQLADPGLYDPGEKARLRTLLAEKAELDRQLEEAEMAWLDASEALEAAEKEMAA